MAYYPERGDQINAVLLSNYEPPAPNPEHPESFTVTLPRSKVFWYGTGFLSGEFPTGITSVNGVPVSAEVRIIYRSQASEPGDGEVIAVVESNQDGTWEVEGLNPALKFDVVGRIPGFNDVIASSVSPVRSDVIEYEISIVESEGYDRAEGEISLL